MGYNRRRHYKHCAIRKGYKSASETPVIALSLRGYSPLRFVSRSPGKRRASSPPPPLALFSQNERSQIKLFTWLFPRPAHLARNELRIVQKNSYRS